MVGADCTDATTGISTLRFVGESVALSGLTTAAATAIGTTMPPVLVPVNDIDSSTIVLELEVSEASINSELSEGGGVVGVLRAGESNLVLTVS